MIKFKNNMAFLIKLCKIFIIFFVLFCGSLINLSQINQSLNLYAGGNIDNFITIIQNSSYVINIQVSKETLVNITLFDENDKLSMILFYEFVKPGVIEYDLAKYLPKGNFTCKILIGENTEVLKLVVI